jgi:C-terminal domain on Strawberry notch homologue/P-loop containing NTP hydrolase pore-1
MVPALGRDDNVRPFFVIPCVVNRFSSSGLTTSTTINQLGYAQRLGLWNTTDANTNTNTIKTSTHAGHYYFDNFPTFCKSLESRGLASLELLALELKRQGSLVARTLSWEGAQFETLYVSLTPHQEHVYDQSVQWWNKCRAHLQTALTMLQQREQNAMIWRIFWSAHQRFFKEVAICAKVPVLVQDALGQLERGHSVVIGLQSTGDDNLQALLLQGNNNNNNNNNNNKRGWVADESQVFPTLLSTVRGVMTNFVQQHFPTTPTPPELTKLNPGATKEETQNHAIQLEHLATIPPPQPLPELVALQQELLDAAQPLDLPPNPLDDLIDRLGGIDVVAEMTGRPGRILRVSSSSSSSIRKKKDKFVYTKRLASSESNKNDERVNLAERRHFMTGTKTVAIISDAASTGMSLHAAHGTKKSQRRRVHCTVELPWSADKAVQQLGRSHRSGQTSAPLYQLVVTTLGGERRFAAAVSKRMASLGALTKGDRRAATGTDMLSEFDLDSKYGKRALKRFSRAIHEHVLEEQARENHNQPLSTYTTNSDHAGDGSVVSAMPSRNAREILDQFIQQRTAARDPIIESMIKSTTDNSRRHSMLLVLAAQELDQIGLDFDARSKADVRVFLNRLAGLVVSRKGLVLRWKMSSRKPSRRENTKAMPRMSRRRPLKSRVRHISLSILPVAP